jgi:hypothetical protein
MRKLSLLLLFCVLGFTSEVAYSHNNPPSQNKVSGYLLKNCPILINANLLIGRVQGTPANYAQFVQTPNMANPDIATVINTYDFKNGIDVGFRAGLGIGCKNIINLSLQYTYFRNKASEGRDFVAASTVTLFNTQMTSHVGLVDVPIRIESFQKQHYQTVDLLIQTATWSPTSCTRLQPFGGVRWLSYKRQLSSTVLNNSDASSFVNTTSNYKVNGTGVLLGTDIKWVFSTNFYFYSNLTAGILAGLHKTTYANLNTTGSTDVSIKHNEKYPLSFDPLLEMRFGFAYERIMRNCWLLSLYIAYEMSSFLHTSSLPINPAGALTLSAPVSPLRTNTLIKTQLGIIGIGFAF